MTSAAFRDQRRMVPIWRSAACAAGAGELESASFAAPPTHSESSSVQPQLEREAKAVAQQWRLAPTVDTAADLVEVSLLTGTPEQAHDAALFLSSRESDLAPGALALVRTVLRDATTPATDSNEPEPGLREFNASTAKRESRAVAAAVARARHQTRILPDSATAWSDLSLAYAEIGKTRDAYRAARTAISLAPTNRLTMRNVARMHVHTGDPDAAHYLLSRSPRTRHDPWLLAAEISTAQLAGRSSKFIKSARRQIDRSVWSPFHASELSAALATQFFLDGRHRQAQKMLGRALRAPTGNTASQAEWLLHNEYASPSIEEHLDTHRVPEARALRGKSSSEFASALQDYAAWLDAEPYSTRPAVAASYVASVAMADPHATIYFALRGLSANAGEWVLWNNLAVGYLLADDTTMGAHALRRARELAHTDDDRATIDATEGLSHYRSGDANGGRACYERALIHFQRAGMETSTRLATLYLIQEELRQPQPLLPERLLNFAFAAPPKSSELRRMANRIRTELDFRRSLVASE